jgi:DNA polymerase I-like protein with 3'-5' exonuclease and polymerase domains
MKFSIRSMLVAPKDHVLIHWDLKQAESWVVAYMANELHMKNSLQRGDIHTDTAIVIYQCAQKDVTKEMRYVGKQQNHAKAYREGYIRAAEIINRQSDKPPYVTVTVAESKLYDSRWHKHYSSIRNTWWVEIEEALDKNNRTLINPYGRVRTFFERWGQELFKQATAHLPQSTVADHTNGADQDELGVKGGLVEIYDQMVKKGMCRLVGQGHDSATVETLYSNKSEVIDLGTRLLQRPLVIKEEMFTIPVECSIGERLGELEAV